MRRWMGENSSLKLPVGLKCDEPAYSIDFGDWQTCLGSGIG